MKHIPFELFKEADGRDIIIKRVDIEEYEKIRMKARMLGIDDEEEGGLIVRGQTEITVYSIDKLKLPDVMLVDVIRSKKYKIGTLDLTQVDLKKHGLNSIFTVLDIERLVLGGEAPRNLSGYFSGTSIGILDITKLKVDTIESVNSIFTFSHIGEIILNGREFSNLKNIEYAFSGSEIGTLDIRNISIPEKVSKWNMFNAVKIKTLKITDRTIGAGELSNIGLGKVEVLEVSNRRENYHTLANELGLYAQEVRE